MGEQELKDDLSDDEIVMALCGLHGEEYEKARDEIISCYSEGLGIFTPADVAAKIGREAIEVALILEDLAADGVIKYEGSTKKG